MVKQASYCDQCEKTFVPEIKTQQLAGYVERVYFTCPHCNKDYTSYYSNVLVKKKQEKVRELAAKYEKERGKNPKQAEKTFKQYQKAKKEVGIAMENLRKRVEK